MSSRARRFACASNTVLFAAAVASGCGPSGPPPRPAEESFALSNDSHFPVGHSIDSSPASPAPPPTRIDGANADNQPPSSGDMSSASPQDTSTAPATPPATIVSENAPSVAPYKYGMTLASSPFAKKKPITSDTSSSVYLLPAKGKSFAGLPLKLDGKVTFHPDKLSGFDLAFPDCKPVVAALSKKWGAAPKDAPLAWQFKDGLVNIADASAKPCHVSTTGGAAVKQ